MLVRTTEDIDRYLELISEATAKVRAWFAAHTGDPLDMLRQMKFETVGFHPIEGHALNLVEQINQTWTYFALAATRQLLVLHPEAGGYKLAPGAYASAPLDIMSEAEGLVGAETFAAVDPHNNRKLALDLAKMMMRASPTLSALDRPKRRQNIFHVGRKGRSSRAIARRRYSSAMSPKANAMLANVKNGLLAKHRADPFTHPDEWPPQARSRCRRACRRRPGFHPTGPVPRLIGKVS
jgi:hypothetical protein